MMQSAYAVSEAQIDRYQADGVVHLPGIASPDWIARLRAGTERVVAAERAEGRPNYFKRLRLWERDADFRGFCLDSGVPAVAARLMRAERVNLLYDQVFIKEPGSNAPTPWHNDQPYWPIRGTQVVTLWVALDPVTLANGGLEFVRGSHRQSPWYRPFSANDKGEVTELFEVDDPSYEEMPDIAAQRDRLDIVSYDLAPGDALAFHALTLHGAPGNTHQDAQRRGYAIRMTGDDVRYYAGKVWNEDIVNPALATGDRLDSDQYPLVWPVAGR